MTNLNKKIITLTIFLLILAFTPQGQSQELCEFTSFDNGWFTFPVDTTNDFYGGLLGSFEQLPDSNFVGGIGQLYSTLIPELEPGPQVVGWWTKKNNRTTQIEVINTNLDLGSSELYVHVIIYNDNCIRILNFCDVFTPGDSHIYDFDNLVRESGGVLSSGGLVDQEGLIVITATSPECSLGSIIFPAVDAPFLKGSVKIDDPINGFDYEFNLHNRKAISSGCSTTSSNGFKVIDGTSNTCKFRKTESGDPIRFLRGSFSTLPGSLENRSDLVIYSFQDFFAPDVYGIIPSSTTYGPVAMIDDRGLAESCPSFANMLLKPYWNQLIYSK